MKYLIIPAQEVQSGDVIFTNNGDGKGIQFCGRVIGLTSPRPHPLITEFRVEVMVGFEEDDETGAHTTIGFRDATLLGVARDDEYVDVDVAAILNKMDHES
jgi:hypothetical protein